MSLATSVATLNQSRPKDPLTGHVDLLIVGAGIWASAWATTWSPNSLARTSPSSTAAMPSVVRGTCSGIRASVQTPICTPSATSSSRGHPITRSPTPMRSWSTCTRSSREDGLGKRLYFRHKVVRANFDSDAALWTVTMERDGQQWDITCNWLFGATGYYNYGEGNAPHFEGQEDFEGQIVHPQFWPEDLDYRGKDVVIGSGATAVTLIPAMADDVAHITMLQRSPTYIMPLPRKDPVANSLRKVLPPKAAYAAARRFNIGKQRFIYGLCQRNPKLARKIIRSINAKMLPAGYEVDVHFAGIQPMGPATVRGTRCRPLPRHRQGQGLRGDRQDRAVHQERNPAGVRS